MTHADKFSRAALAAIAEEVGDLIADCAPQLSRPGASAARGRRAGARSTAAAAAAPARSPAEVIDTFEVWTLDGRALAAARARAHSRRNAADAKHDAARMKHDTTAAKHDATAAKHDAQVAKRDATAAKRDMTDARRGAEADARPSLVESARRTGRWHHQIKIDGRAVAFARSTEPEADGSRLRGLFFSPLASKVDEAITWIDERERRAAERDTVVADPLVRLLIVLSHQVHAFWLLEEDAGRSDVLLIDAPPGFARPGRKALLDERAFFDLLLRHKPVKGLA